MAFLTPIFPQFQVIATGLSQVIQLLWEDARNGKSIRA
jgi:hypothetical protein